MKRGSIQILEVGRSLESREGWVIATVGKRTYKWGFPVHSIRDYIFWSDKVVGALAMAGGTLDGCSIMEATS